jgi:membrane-associated phospholipid phosphatase
MNKQVAHLISTLGHPFILLPVVFVALAVKQVGWQGAWPALSGLCLAMLVMGTRVVVRTRRGLVSNLDVSTREQRTRSVYLPMLFLIFVIAGVLYVFRQPFVGETLFFGGMMAVCMVINFWLKISQHTLMITYLGCIVWPVSFTWGLVLLICAPFVAWSRIVLGRHQWSEVIAGGLVAILFGCLNVWIFS